MVSSDHAGNEVSPCSPSTYPWMFLGFTRQRRATYSRSRAESSVVPLPMTREAGNPLSVNVTQVSTSTGLVMRSKMPWKPASMTECTMLLHDGRRCAPGGPPGIPRAAPGRRP